MQTLSYIITLAVIIWFIHIASTLLKKRKEDQEERALKVLQDKYLLESIMKESYAQIESVREGLTSIQMGKVVPNHSATDTACPSCKAGYLIVRKSRFGEFLGCTNFPVCKFTKSIEVENRKLNYFTNEFLKEIQKVYN